MAVLPIAVLPLWQAAQPETIPVWFILAPVNVTVLWWQVSHGCVVVRWVADLPLAMVPLWQVAQPDEMPTWFIVAPVNVTVLW